MVLRNGPESEPRRSVLGSSGVGDAGGDVLWRGARQPREEKEGEGGKKDQVSSKRVAVFNVANSRGELGDNAPLSKLRDHANTRVRQRCRGGGGGSRSIPCETRQTR